MAINNDKKYSTGIDGLDSLLYGGIHLEFDGDQGAPVNSDGGLLILNRGKHGVNKVHLAMQMCEGLQLAMKEKKKQEHGYIEGIFGNGGEEKKNKDILFFSLNKNTERLRDTYIGFYLQRLINDIQVLKMGKDDFDTEIQHFVWEEGSELENYSGKLKNEDGFSNEGVLGQIKQGIKDGMVFYDDRTHGLCLKSANGDTLVLYTLKMEETAKEMNIAFVGRKEPELNDENYVNNTMKGFDKMIGSLKNLYENRCSEINEKIKKAEQELKGIKDNDKPRTDNENERFAKITFELESLLKEKKDKSFNCVMIDGLSRLTEDEIGKCSFSVLTDTLRCICKVGVITADEKLAPSGIAVDIVFDMEIHEEHNPDCVQYALRISKCLYQKNVYGWHSYKMRRTGIVVIPSLHFQMNSRFHMDDAIQDARMDIGDIPYNYWINEIAADANKGSSIYIHQESDYGQLNKGELFALSVDKMDSGIHLIKKVKTLIKQGTGNHILFIDLSRTRKEFYDNYINTIVELRDYVKCNNEKSDAKKIHLFNFRPGHIHDDDFLYTIEKQVRAIIRENYQVDGNKLKENELKDFYKNIHLVIGDINYINFAYPCLNRDNLLLPAISNFTKKHHMINFIYSTASWEISIMDKEKELYQQMKVVSTMLF